MKSTVVFLIMLSSLCSSSAQIAGSVKIYNGRPVIMINDQPQYPLIYSLTDVPGGRWSWEELPNYNIQNFYKNGFRLFQLDIFFDHLGKKTTAFPLIHCNCK